MGARPRLAGICLLGCVQCARRVRQQSEGQSPAGDPLLLCRPVSCHRVSCVEGWRAQEVRRAMLKPVGFSCVDNHPHSSPDGVHAAPINSSACTLSPSQADVLARIQFAGLLRAQCSLAEPPWFHFQVPRVLRRRDRLQPHARVSFGLRCRVLSVPAHYHTGPEE